MFLSCRAWQR
ncbi:hypothetical protein D049_4829A, partial [Vibrio parahaemolyticus VPTS-2010]